jgi:hypothetical protein
MGALVKTRDLFPHGHKSILSGFASLLLSIILISTGQLRAQETAVVLLEPQPLTLNQGQTGRLFVRIEDASEIYGVQIDMTFDTNQVRVIDADETKPGLQVLSGDFLTQGDGFEAANEVNNETGLLLYAYSRLAPAEPVSGSGTLFEFEVEALQPGSIELQFDRLIVASPEGEEMPVQLGITEGNGGGAIFVPNFTATAPPVATADIATASPTSAAQTAVITPQPTATAALSAAGEAIPEILANENTLTPTETQASSALQTPANPPLSTIPTPLLENEPEQATISKTAESPIPTATAVEIAAPIAGSEEENGPAAAEEATRPLTVIGENQRLEETQAQPATPAPSAKSAGTIDSITLAAGLIALSAGLIAIWFLMHIKPSA